MSNVRVLGRCGECGGRVIVHTGLTALVKDGPRCEMCKSVPEEDPMRVFNMLIEPHPCTIRECDSCTSEINDTNKSAPVWKEFNPVTAEDDYRNLRPYPNKLPKNFKPTLELVLKSSHKQLEDLQNQWHKELAAYVERAKQEYEQRTKMQPAAWIVEFSVINADGSETPERHLVFKRPVSAHLMKCATPLYDLSKLGEINV